MGLDAKIKQLWHKVKAFFSTLSKKTRYLMVSAFLIILAAVVTMAVLHVTKPYSVLFTGLTASDMSSVLTTLDSRGVTDYKVQNNDTILVPESQEASLKASLLMEGYPSSGFGYSMYLDHVGSLSTESDRTTLYLFDLQDRLSAVVRCFDGVKDASVTIAQGEDRRFVLNSDDVVHASASVLVTMNGALKLTDQQAAAIRNLIGHAVKDLAIDDVSIADTAGNTYSGGDQTTASDASQLKLALQKQVNNNVRASILEVLTPLFGADNLSVSVNSTVDVSRTYEDSVTYTQPDWAADGSTNGEGIIGSKVYDNTILSSNNTTVGGVAGTESNSDLSTYTEGTTPSNDQGQQIRTSGQVNYNVDTSHTQKDSAGGIITDVMVSVSINSSVFDSIDTDALIRHVARAAGIGSDVETEKISILPFPFYSAAQTNPIQVGTGIPAWAFYALIAGLALFLIVMLVILLLRRRIKKRRSPVPPPQIVYQPEPAVRGANIMDLHTERSMELRKDVRDFAEENPEIAAQMVRSWLKGGEETNG